ncbi:NAD(P)H-binding protein [Geomesophilobacter sediminis]|uniref:NAD(P)H-binding protein n=1 Tax=Geomesophilobacter sediminis TaxID=2798584 RepID=A0A8J7JM19_9BACT|nr:NAD(P)H-binding protein [Geomesophilobacter sediminis]MBJ6725580.1 NAD(P)H-binding protein [Geomesophilobacter sediminis]
MEVGSGKVLVTGATGFIGGRLVRALVAEGHQVRCLVRHPAAKLPEGVERAAGDLLQKQTLGAAVAGIDTAYYLVHSMAGGVGFERRDRESAENFTAAAERAGVRRVIYLGGLGDVGSGLSEHLASRAEVANILGSGRFLTTWLRAAVIIGPGSASYEMVKALVERLPVMVVPRWVYTRCQPIAVDDVIRYLLGCLGDERTAGETFDIGGPEILSYRDMIKRFARLQGKDPLMIPVPVLTPWLSSYWVVLVTPVDPAVAVPLVEGLKNDVICRDDRIRMLMPFPLTAFDDAVRQALGTAPPSVPGTPDGTGPK